MALWCSTIGYMRVKQDDSAGDTPRAPRPSRTSEGADTYLQQRRTAENFPVALRVLPPNLRGHLIAVYDVARVIDDLGDQAEGDRTALLQAFRADLDTLWRGGQPQAAVLCRLTNTLHACRLSQQPFIDLIEANLLDQHIKVYPTYADLLGYCALSANPVGRIVLEVFGVSTPDRVELSDRICTALQIIEHCQDVAEDRQADRIYLPLEDLNRFGVQHSDLDAAVSSPQVRQLVEFEAERAGKLLQSGSPLLGMLSGWARLAVSGYIAGGQAAVIALRRSDWDILTSSPRARRSDLVRQLAAIMMRRRVGP